MIIGDTFESKEWGVITIKGLARFKKLDCESVFSITRIADGKIYKEAWGESSLQQIYIDHWKDTDRFGSVIEV